MDTGNVLWIVADSVPVQAGRCAEHCFGVDWHQLSVCQGDFGENIGFLELQSHSAKPCNLMWQFSDCQRIGCGSKGRIFCSLRGFLSTETSEMNRRPYCTPRQWDLLGPCSCLQWLQTVRAVRVNSLCPLLCSFVTLRSPGLLMQMGSVLDGGDCSMSANSTNPAEQDWSVAGWVSGGYDIISCALATSLWGPLCLAAELRSADTGAALHQLAFSWVLSSL